MDTIINLQFQRCLKLRKIREFSRGRDLAGKELKSAKSDLESAQETFKLGNYKWSTIQCYYSMFHSARALIYAKNFSERSHRCLIIALRVLYVNNGKLAFEFIEALERAKMLREDADYYDRWSDQATQFLLDKAKELLIEVKNILREI